MTHIEFPPVEQADEHGLLGIGGEATCENLLEAYKRGIFPWPWSEEFIAWFAPPTRALLSFDTIHIPRSLQKLLKKRCFAVRVNTAFEAVMTQCRKASNRKRQKGTWITPELMDGYLELHRRGFAHSFEVYRRDVLVGGLYGVGIGLYFSGESMFHSEDNASKVALVEALRYLSSLGIEWMDCQVLTPTTAQFGAADVDRSYFMGLLKAAVSKPQPKWMKGELNL